MGKALILSAALALTPIVASAQVPGMTFPADPYAASSPLSHTHVPIAERVAHTDPSKFEMRPSVHNGSGPMRYMALFDSRSGSVKPNLGVNLIFLHRGELLPGGGIGQHFHNYTEEMFIILDGEAEFTIDGRTSTLQGPAGAPVLLGHNHAITNQTDKPVQWMNINVSLLPGLYDAFNLDEGRVGAPQDARPQFINMSLAKSLDKPVENFDGGKGTAMYHRALGPTNFYTTWSYVDHLVLPSGATAGPDVKDDMAEIYYVLSGQGTATIQGETINIKEGDAVPAALGESRAFAAAANSDLEFMIFGIARDQEAKKNYMLAQGSAERSRRR